jgi:hypothetical protein
MFVGILFRQQLLFNNLLFRNNALTTISTTIQRQHMSSQIIRTQEQLKLSSLQIITPAYARYIWIWFEPARRKQQDSFVKNVKHHRFESHSAHAKYIGAESQRSSGIVKGNRNLPMILCFDALVYRLSDNAIRCISILRRPRIHLSDGYEWGSHIWKTVLQLPTLFVTRHAMMQISLDWILSGTSGSIYLQHFLIWFHREYASNNSRLSQISYQDRSEQHIGTKLEKIFINDTWNNLEASFRRSVNTISHWDYRKCAQPWDCQGSIISRRIHL